MKKLHASIIGICFLSSTAYAVGGDNTHTQGVRFAGRGFDESVPLQSPEQVPWFALEHWPDVPSTPLTYKFPDGRGTLHVVATCTAPPAATGAKSHFAMCTGAVSLTDSTTGAPVPTAACDLDKPATGEVPLLAVSGRWRRDGSLELNDRMVTFACAPTFPPRVSIKNLVDFGERTRQLTLRESSLEYLTTPSNTGSPVTYGATLTNVQLTALDLSNINTSVNLGVIAKCYFWGFAKDRAPDLKTYQACIRAARADYCGNGKSQTEPGTWIQIYETPETEVGKPIEVRQDPTSCNPPTLPLQLCFEAIWNEERALCVSHARFEQMPIQKCGKEFKYPLTNEGKPAAAAEEPVLHCQFPDYGKLKGMSRVKNRSGINDIKGRVWSCHNDIQCP